jgi:hypothetical protein
MFLWEGKLLFILLHNGSANPNFSFLAGYAWGTHMLLLEFDELLKVYTGRVP